MPWEQVYLPFSSLPLSVFLAFLPLLGLLYFLGVRKTKGLYACALSLGIAIVLALTIWKMPPILAIAAITNGMAFGLFPIGWIILHAMWLYNMVVESGQFNHIRNYLSFLTPDRRLQAVLIAFVLGAFLEGTAGFGTPVAIAAALLIGLGFPPLTAAAIALVSNAAPVAFGGLGLPSTVASQITGLDIFQLGKAAALQVALLCFIAPFWISSMIAGFRKTLEISPILLGGSLLFVGLQYSIAYYINPYLPLFLSATVTLLCLGSIFHFWQPKNIWRFPGDSSIQDILPPNPKELLRASLPFIILAILVFLWADLQYTGFKIHLLGWESKLFDPQILWPGLHESILRMPPTVSHPTLYGAKYFFNLISAPGTAILLAGLISIPLLPNYSFKKGAACYWQTLYQLRYALGTLPLVLGLAYLMNYSGMSSALGLAFYTVGALFPFFSPVIGYIGVFLTGSEVSSNALFGLLQRTNAEALGFDPYRMVAGNMVGGGAAKMIAPQTIAVATAATGQVGQEGELLMRTWKSSLFFLLLGSLFTGFIAYAF